MKPCAVDVGCVVYEGLCVQGSNLTDGLGTCVCHEGCWMYLILRVLCVVLLCVVVLSSRVARCGCRDVGGGATEAGGGVQ